MEQQVTEPPIKKLKPRALVLMADQKDLEKIKDFIETLVEVKLVYVTSAPSRTALRIVKEPRDNHQPFETNTVHTRSEKLDDFSFNNGYR